MSSILWDRFERNVRNHAGKPALIYPDLGAWKTVTYSQLRESANRFARGLQACRVDTGMRAALMTPPSAEFFALAFALLKTGVIPVILDPAIGLGKVRECLKESRPDVFIGNCLTHILRVLSGWGRGSIKHNLTLRGIEKRSSHGINFDPQIANDAPAAIVYTSGSTGLPKGAVYTQGNFAAQLDILQKTFNIDRDEIDLPAFPLYVIIDVLLGVTSVIPDMNFPVPGRTDPRRVLAAIQRFEVTNMFASPVVLDILGKHGGHVKLNSLKRVITAGAPAPFKVQEKFRELLPQDSHLYGIYGATEALPIARTESNEVLGEKEKTAQGAGVCLGRPVPGMDVHVIRITDEPIQNWDDSLQLATNVVGEITVQGPAVTRAYISKGDANRLGKIRHGNEIIHRMGDVGYFDENGRLWYCGRKSQRVETDHSIFFTEQIEGVFNAHPAVYRTALVGVEGQPVLWVELQDHRTNREKVKKELIELASGHSQASQIRAFLFMKKFPTDVRHNSKIIREKLASLAARRMKS